MTTPLDIITKALKAARLLGVGQTALAEDANDAFVTLNWMMKQWQVKRFLVYRTKDVSVSSTGQLFYTIGPTGDIVTTVRPEKIDSGFARYVGTGGDFNDDFNDDFSNIQAHLDYPLEFISAREDYNRILKKRYIGYPTYYFYDAEIPDGNIYVWPRPATDIWTLHFSIKEILPRFTSLYEDIALPDEYFAALYYNLAVILITENGKPLRPDLVVLAKDALSTIRGSNIQVPTMSIEVPMMSDYSRNIQGL
jgi:hypothetical protein